MKSKDKMDEDTTTSVELELDLISKPEISYKSQIKDNIISLQ
jgi:hypothetical protein